MVSPWESSGSGRVYVGADKVLLTGGTRKQDESFFKSGDGRFVYSTDGVGAIYVREVGRAGEALKIDTPTGSVPGLSDDGSTVTTGRPDLGIALVTHFEARPRPPEVSGTPSIAQLFKLAGTWKPRKDPLALDLGAPGLHTLEDLGEGIVRFDHDGNGSRTGTGWLTGEDAWVVLDRDGDGEISIGAELFGVDILKRDDSQVTTFQFDNSRPESVSVALLWLRFVWRLDNAGTPFLFKYGRLRSTSFSK